MCLVYLFRSRGKKKDTCILIIKNHCVGTDYFDETFRLNVLMCSIFGAFTGKKAEESTIFFQSSFRL